eukprot:scaffold3608_cov65-Phaeocystis_antarctica.AAC.12
MAPSSTPRSTNCSARRALVTADGARELGHKADSRSLSMGPNRTPISSASKRPPELPSNRQAAMSFIRARHAS